MRQAALEHTIEPVMRKLTIGILIAVILAGVLFAILHVRHRIPQQSFVGIGVQMTVKDGAFQIMGIVADSPAAKAGLHRGLVIQRVDGTDIVGKPLTECVDMMRGPVGSKVQLEVVDPAKGETNTVEITRAKFSLPLAR